MNPNPLLQTKSKFGTFLIIRNLTQNVKFDITFFLDSASGVSWLFPHISRRANTFYSLSKN